MAAQQFIRNAMRIILMICSLLLAQQRVSQAHVVLTFPPARTFGIDFLENYVSITEGPCGIPRGLNNPSSLLAGVQYNITWENNNLHKGGFRIELLDNSYSLIQTLFPAPSNATTGNGTDSLTSAAANSSSEWGFMSDPTATSTIVVLPSAECFGCVIRLVKQVGEVPLPAKAGYIVRSCADVDIRRKVTRREYCSYHGTYSTDEQACRCEGKYDGPTCQNQDECLTVRDCNYNGACVQTDAMAYPHRQCYCAPGFFGMQCEYRCAASINMTKVANLTGYKSMNLTSDILLAWRIVNDTAADDGDEIEFIMKAKNVTTWIALGLRSSDTGPECRSFPMYPPSEVGVSMVPLVYTKGGIADAAANWTNTPPLPTLHPMECLDVVWAAAKGKMSRVRDMYTPTLAKPREDEFYGGRQSLTSATAFEEGNTTTLIFRRRIDSYHPTDAQINFGDEMHVVYARGQDPDFPVDLPLRNISLKNNPNLTNPNFYPLDELKYHGTDPSRRGYRQIKLLPLA